MSPPVTRDHDHDIILPDIIVDSALLFIRQKIIAQGRDEILLPPTTHEFSEKKLGITWNGVLILTNGKFVGLQTIRRVGDAKLSIIDGSDEVAVNIDLSLTDPTFTNDFHLTFMGREKDGSVVGTAELILFNLIFAVHLSTRRMRMIDFKFKDISSISAEVYGLGTILSFLTSKIMQIILNQKKKDIAHTVEAKLKSILADLFAKRSMPAPIVAGAVGMLEADASH
ncbi:hypothetical protein Ocin01_03936 [Orchesella cincta]|uniref:Uncharacterized protein n=1 Tax=Orchesella cincta TaxID=48709 RepID=A0A1D2NC04_ORCCI|nr:hypothetical protein Ocin01_03936 [Orchesella cincta]